MCARPLSLIRFPYTNNSFSSCDGNGNQQKKPLTHFIPKKVNIAITQLQSQLQLQFY